MKSLRQIALGLIALLWLTACSGPLFRRRRAGGGAGFFIRSLLQENGSLKPYGIIFGAGAAVLALSTVCFALVREPPAPLERDRPAFHVFLREGWFVLQGDARFRLFLYVQLLAGLTTMTFPFYIVQARRVSGLTEAEVGTLIAAQALGGLALHPLWGLWGDRRGKLSLLKALTAISAISPVLAIGPAWLAALPPVVTISGYVATFFFLGATLNGGIIADIGYLMEISPDDRRAEYSGYMNALVAPGRLLPLAAGALVDAVSFRFVFGLGRSCCRASWMAAELCLRASANR